MDCINGHVADVVRAIRVWPDGNDDKFGKVKVGRCADKFRDGPQRWGKFSMMRVTEA